MDDLSIQIDGHKATLTLNRPKTMNAITGPMWAGLRDAFGQVSDDDTIRVLIVTGANGEFCSGADVGPDADQGERAGSDPMKVVNEAAQALHDLAIPTIAKVDGIAAGAGLNLALGCDLVVASDRSRFSEIFARRALSLDFGGSWLLPRLVGMHKAKELALLADVISAEEAQRIGLINKVVPVAELDVTVDEWADRLVAGPPIALAATKQMLQRSFSRSFDEALAEEARAQVHNFGTEDVLEAATAWIEKRDAEFKGK